MCSQRVAPSELTKVKATGAGVRKTFVHKTASSTFRDFVDCDTRSLVASQVDFLKSGVTVGSCIQSLSIEFATFRIALHEGKFVLPA